MIFLYFYMFMFCLFVCVGYFNKKLLFLLSLELCTLWLFLIYFLFSHTLNTSIFTLMLFSVFLVVDSVFLSSLLICSSRQSSFSGSASVTF